jgi:plasmid maintenance system antidote protein VapI
MNPPITSAMSIRFGAFFGQSPEFGHGIQLECDFHALAKNKCN